MLCDVHNSNPPRPERYTCMDTAELLAAYADLINQYGPDSDEANAFVWGHTEDQEFIGLAWVAKHLKLALSSSEQWH